MVRHRVTITKKAAEILSTLVSAKKKDAAELIEAMIIEKHAVNEDNNIFQLELPKSCLIYEVNLPFAFPYELEKFDSKYSDIPITVYLERIPKRYVGETTGFFKTKGIIIIPLKVEELEFLRKENPDNPAIFGNTKGSNEYYSIAFEAISKVILAYRRAENIYYNLGVIEPPMNREAFGKNVRLTVRVDSLPIHTVTFMPVRHPSKIVVNMKMEREVHEAIIESISTSLEPDKDFLFYAQQFREAGIGFFYHEQWNLSLLQSVIAMETGLASLILKTEASTLVSKIHNIPSEDLMQKYHDAQGLPNKNSKFLFPILEYLKAQNITDALREITPYIYNKKTNEGIYELRSRIVHEGISANKDHASLSIELADRYLGILQAAKTAMPSARPKHP